MAPSCRPRGVTLLKTLEADLAKLGIGIDVTLWSVLDEEPLLRDEDDEDSQEREPEQVVM